MAAEVSFRQLFCRAIGCGLMFFICRPCYRGQAYWSDECRRKSRREQLRKANRRYLDDPEVRHEHRERMRDQKAGRDSMAVTDELLQRARSLDPKFGLRYNKYYIAISQEGNFFNFLSVTPKKKFARLRVTLPEDPKFNERLEQSGFDFECEKRRKRYLIKLTQDQLKQNSDLVSEIMHASYEEWVKG